MQYKHLKQLISIPEESIYQKGMEFRHVDFIAWNFNVHMK